MISPDGYVHHFQPRQGLYNPPIPPTNHRGRNQPPRREFGSRFEPERSFNLHSFCSVKPSGSPAKYFRKACVKTSLSEVTPANSVMEERNFRSSGEPKI